LSDSHSLELHIFQRSTYQLKKSKLDPYNLLSKTISITKPTRQLQMTQNVHQQHKGIDIICTLETHMNKKSLQIFIFKKIAKINQKHNKIRPLK